MDMDKDEAIHEVEEIKQVIADSRKSSDRRKYWIAAGAIAIGITVIILTLLVIFGLMVWHTSTTTTINTVTTITPAP